MKKKRGSAISLGIICFLLLTGAPQAQDLKARIRSASGLFLGRVDPTVTSAQVLKSILELLDITAAGRGQPREIDNRPKIFRKN
jgi:hypothetical protein